MLLLQTNKARLARRGCLTRATAPLQEAAVSAFALLFQKHVLGSAGIRKAAWDPGANATDSDLVFSCPLQTRGA